MVRAEFPETTWGLVARLRETAQRPTALDDLCQRYWRPVYLWVRSAWAKTDSDAQDLAQAFFVWLLDGEALRRYSPERGGFRPYLKTLLRRFVGHQETALQRLKRGGDIARITLDDSLAAPPANADPEQLFDRAWISELVTTAVARVAERFRADGKGQTFAIYEAYELQGEQPTYTDLADRLGLSVQQIKHGLSRVREAVRREIRAELRDTTANDDELEGEWRDLFG